MGWAETEAAIARRRQAWADYQVAEREAEVAAPLPMYQGVNHNDLINPFIPGHKSFIAGIVTSPSSVLQIEGCALDRDEALMFARWILATLE